MIKYESNCVSCGFPCMKDSCPNYKVRVCICDKCKEEVERLFWYNGFQYCKDCLVSEFDEVDCDDDC